MTTDLQFQKSTPSILLRSEKIIPSRMGRRVQKGDLRERLLRRVGTQLIKARNARNLSQGELGDMVGCGGAMISHIESMSRLPSAELLFGLSDVLGVGVDYFLEDPAAAQETSGIQFILPGHLSMEDRQRIGAIIKKIDRAPKDDRELLIRVAEKILLGLQMVWLAILT